MLEKLRLKWKVSHRQLMLILCVFAITGTTTAYISRSITSWLNIDGGFAYYFTKLMVLVFGYQIIILIVSVFFGQFRFFWNYEKKILTRMRLLKAHPKTVVIFASGTGTNAQKIIDYSKQKKSYSVKLIVCNKPDAGVVAIAKSENVETLIIEKDRFYKSDDYLKILKNYHPDLIVLAGFLWKIPDNMIQAFPGKIINIHPALLPSFGGKGMYGKQVHEAVIAAGTHQSGITIHFVDGNYDTGRIIFQEKLPVLKEDNADSLAEKVRLLEHQHYPLQIEKLCKN